MLLHFFMVKHTMLRLGQLVSRVCVHWLDDIGPVSTVISRRVCSVLSTADMMFLFDCSYFQELISFIVAVYGQKSVMIRVHSDRA